MSILINDLELPKEGEYAYHLTIRSDGKVEGSQQVGERMHSIRTWAIEVVPVEHLKVYPVDAKFWVEASTEGEASR